jgi:hypothetical protein
MQLKPSHLTCRENADHTALEIVCAHCAVVVTMPLPLLLDDALSDRIRGVRMIHANCAPKPEKS